MHHSTAIFTLRFLAREELLQVRGTTFRYVSAPQPVHILDVREAFQSIADFLGATKGQVIFSAGTALDVWCQGSVFEKIFKAIYIVEKLFPVVVSENDEGFSGRDLPLPSLFIGSEKTQVRQIPLVESPPWPFKFLLELGGAIVCAPDDRREFVAQARQFLGNHPQFDIRVDIKEWPDGKVILFTWWFGRVSGEDRG